MASISVSTGKKEIEIIRDGENVGSIYFSPADSSLIPRLNEAQKKLAALKPPEAESVDDKINALDQLDKEARQILDEAFDYPCSDIIFGKSFTFTTHLGASMLEQFLDGALKIIKAETEAEHKKAQAKREKYTAKYKK